MDDELTVKRRDFLAKKVKEARKARGLGQEELGRLVHTSVETIKKIEQRKTNSPGFFLVADIAEKVGLQVTDLIYTEGADHG